MSHQGNHTLTAKDVVFVEGFERSASLFKNDATLRIKDLLAKIESICIKSGELSSEEIAILFGNGIACEVLRPGAADWQTGSLHLNLQFKAGAMEMGAIAAPAATPAAVAPAAAPSPEPEPAVMPDEAFGLEASSNDDMNAFADNSTAISTDEAIEFDDLGDSLGGDFSLDDQSLDDQPLEDVSLNDEQPADSDFDLEGFDLDSTAAPADSLDELSSPWDLSDDLDSMLMAN